MAMLFETKILLIGGGLLAIGGYFAYKKTAKGIEESIEGVKSSVSDALDSVGNMYNAAKTSVGDFVDDVKDVGQAGIDVITRKDAVQSGNVKPSNYIKGENPFTPLTEQTRYIGGGMATLGEISGSSSNFKTPIDKGYLINQQINPNANFSQWGIL